MNNEHNIADMYCGLLEGVLFNLYHCYKLLADLMVPPQKILVSGGIVRSGFWTQMAADIFQKEMNISNIEHVSLLGVVALMMKSLNLVQDLGQSKLESGGTIFPNKKMEDIYIKRFEKYLDLYNSVQ